jgi:hypothetical protein
MVTGSEALLHAGRRCRPALKFDPRSHVQWLDLPQVAYASALAPSKKLVRGAGIGSTGMGVLDLSGEKLEEAHAGAFAAVRHHCGQRQAYLGNPDQGHHSGVLTSSASSSSSKKGCGHRVGA